MSVENRSCSEKEICILDMYQEQAVAVVQRCSVKMVFIEISQNSQENTCDRVPFLIKLQASASNFIKKETGTSIFL